MIFSALNWSSFPLLTKWDIVYGKTLSGWMPEGPRGAKNEEVVMGQWW